MVVPSYPMSSLELDHEEQLWRWLDDITTSGSTVMAIPHNTNLAEGGAFRGVDEAGEPMDAEYAALRNEYEPLIEIHQAKGNSEVNGALWKNDEYASFENYTAGPLREDNYVRWALKKGLDHEANVGVNPFKFGLIGSTDTHSATPGNVEENDTFISNHAIMDAIPIGRATEPWILDESKTVYEVLNPGGLVAVYAPANSRGHIYDGLKSKEVYGTSGSRIELRFFGGWNFTPGIENAESLVEEGYQHGVPMGSDLISDEKTNSSPQFLIWAKKDAEGANLDRIQVIKGWNDGRSLQEKIYNVALSDNRIPDSDGQVPPTGASVDLQTGEWSKDKGDAELMTLWTDTDYDPLDNAFYYVRVIEIPTANWRLWDNIRYGSEFAEDTHLTVQERAWSSPIWVYSEP